MYQGLTKGFPLSQSRNDWRVETEPLELFQCWVFAHNRLLIYIMKYLEILKNKYRSVFT